MFTDTYRSIFKANSTSLFDFQPNQRKNSACTCQFTLNSGTPQANTDSDIAEAVGGNFLARAKRTDDVGRAWEL